MVKSLCEHILKYILIPNLDNNEIFQYFEKIKIRGGGRGGGDGWKEGGRGRGRERKEGEMTWKAFEGKQRDYL